jgi:hypothetical protein
MEQERQHADNDDVNGWMLCDVMCLAGWRALLAHGSTTILAPSVDVWSCTLIAALLSELHAYCICMVSMISAEAVPCCMCQSCQIGPAMPLHVSELASRLFLCDVSGNTACTDR